MTSEQRTKLDAAAAAFGEATREKRTVVRKYAASTTFLWTVPEYVAAQDRYLAALLAIEAISIELAGGET